MHSNLLLNVPGSGKPEPFSRLPDDQLGKVYVDVPHRYFTDLADLAEYVREARQMGGNVLLLLPHFFPSFSEYVVKDYERPCTLFGSWKHFAGFMKFTADLGMDRMIDIPFNHADWQANNLQRHWFIKHEEQGIEAGADDSDADGNRVRINWGAYVLDNGNPDLITYWLEKVIYPHVEKYHVNAIRIDAAWGLDPEGLTTIVRETKRRFPHVWFLAENLGMDPLINLARSGINAGAERFFNNYYWYTGGRGIPVDVYRLQKLAPGRPTCTIFGNHDVLQPAMRALAMVRREQLQDVDLSNPKAVHRRIIEQDRLHGPRLLAPHELDEVSRLMALDFILASFLSSDLMLGAGNELALLERVDVLRSGPEHFARGVETDLGETMQVILQARASDPLFNTEGTIMPFGEWRQGQPGLKGYCRRSGTRTIVVAVNTDQGNSLEFPLPKHLRQAAKVGALTPEGRVFNSGSKLPDHVLLSPLSALVLYTLE